MSINYKELKQGGFIRQKDGDYFSMRLKVVGGNLESDKLQKVVDISKAYGKGYVHFTSRQSLEIPFIPYENIETVKKELEKEGMSPAICGAGVRTITACHGNAVCANGDFNTYEMAKKIDERFHDYQLPHKFKIGITGCANNCLKAEENDLGIKGVVEVEWEKENCILCGICEKTCPHDAITVSKEKGFVKIDEDLCVSCGKCAKKCPKDSIKKDYGYRMYFGGLFGNHIMKGMDTLPIVKDEELLFELIDYTLKYYSKLADKGERFRRTLERDGWNQFIKEVNDIYNQKEHPVLH